MKRFFNHATLVFVIGILVSFPISESAQTLSLNDGSIVQSKTQRIGINIGAIDYWDNGQILKNLVGAINPGFEPLTTKQIWALTSPGTSTSFTNNDPYDPVPQNFWAGATFTIVKSQTNNGQQGCTGTIASNTGEVPITSIVRIAGLVTVTTASPTGYITGNPISIKNVTDSSFNGYPSGKIISVLGNTIVFAQAGANSTSTGGVVDQLAPPIYTTSSACGGPFSVGDIVTVSLTTTPTPESWWENSKGGFWSQISNGGKLTSDTTDLCATCGSQAIKFNASAAGSSAGGKWIFDGDQVGSPNNFVLMNGTYQISFWAKSASGSPSLRIEAARSSTGGFKCGTYTQGLTSTWTQYTFTCTASETASSTAVGSSSLTVLASGGTAYLDNVSFEKTESTQASVLRDEVIGKLQSFNPGTFRYWVNQNGESADNWTRPDYARGPSGGGAGYFVGPDGSNSVTLSLEDYLVICQILNAEPYLEVPVTLTSADAVNLIEFLAGPSSTTYGARRAALGQEDPWTSVFTKIHLSYCNECWNFISFAGQNLPSRASAPNDPSCPWTCPNGYYDYSIMAQSIFSAMRSAPDYSSAPFDLVMNLQTGGYTLADDAIKTARPDSVEIEDYTDFQVNSFATDTALWQPAFVEVYDKVVDPAEPTGFYHSLNDYPKQNTCGASGTSACNVNIYEWGDSTNEGTIDQAHLDYATAGAGQGIVSALEPLLNLQYYGIQNQNYFALTEFYNSGPNGELAKMWGSVVDMGGATNNVRPQFLSMSLVNKSIIGPMYSCPISSNPAFNFAANTLNGSIVPPGIPALSNVPYLYSFCFENGTSRSLVLINTDLSNSHTVSFAGTNPPQGAVTERQYAPSSPDDMNEAPTGSASNLAPATVSLSTSSLSTPGSITLPPYSVTALDYTASGTATAALPTFTPAAGTYAASQTVTIGDATSGATIYYTTNGTTPTTSSTKYSGTITVGASAALQAIAVKTGFTNSPVATAIYTIGTVLPAPTFSLAAGTYITVQSVTISDATAGTTIYYTTNGTTPTSSSTKYSGAITVSASETLEAIAIKTGFTNSSVATAPYTISTVLPAPAFSPAAGTYTASQSVTISDAASGTTIYYTTNGTTPTASSTKYSGTITVSASETLEAIAVKTGFNNSSTTSGAYVISPSLSATGSAGSTSYISYSSGAFTATDLALNSGASITSGMLRLTDGGLNESRTAWFAKQVPIQSFITDFTFQQLNALADGMTFAIQGHGISAKGFSGAGLGYQNIWGSVAVKFDLFSNAGEGPDSTGLYTNGTVPTVPAVNLSTTGINLHSGDVMHAHLVYNGTNLTMTLTDTVTKATVTEVFPVNIPSFVGGNTAYVGFTGGTGSQSATQDVLSWSFESTVGPSVAEPTFSPFGGAYASAQTVLISDATAGTTIYYTTNGAAPTTSSSVYSSAITVSATETLEAIAVKTGYTTSPVSTGAYTITGSGTSSVAEDFTITPSGTTATVARGGLVAYALTVAPLSPATTFPTAIKLSANGLPSGATYSFSPAAVAEGAGATAVTLMVQLPQVASAKQPAGGIGSLFAPRMGPIALGLLLLPFSGGLRRAGKRMGRAIPMVLLLVMAMSVVIGLGGCGTTNTLISSTQRSYAVAVIGTAGSISRSTTVTLIVMQ